jgi:hypothetical protein
MPLRRPMATQTCASSASRRDHAIESGLMQHLRERQQLLLKRLLGV